MDVDERSGGAGAWHAQAQPSAAVRPDGFPADGSDGSWHYSVETQSGATQSGASGKRPAEPDGAAALWTDGDVGEQLSPQGEAKRFRQIALGPPAAARCPQQLQPPPPQPQQAAGQQGAGPELRLRLPSQGPAKGNGRKGYDAPPLSCSGEAAGQILAHAGFPADAKIAEFSVLVDVPCSVVPAPGPPVMRAQAYPAKLLVAQKVARPGKGSGGKRRSLIMRAALTAAGAEPGGTLVIRLLPGRVFAVSALGPSATAGAEGEGSQEQPGRQARGGGRPPRGSATAGAQSGARQEGAGGRGQQQSAAQPGEQVQGEAHLPPRDVAGGRAAVRDGSRWGGPSTAAPPVPSAATAPAPGPHNAAAAGAAGAAAAKLAAPTAGGPPKGANLAAAAGALLRHIKGSGHAAAAAHGLPVQGGDAAPLMPLETLLSALLRHGPSDVEAFIVAASVALDERRQLPATAGGESGACDMEAEAAVQP